MSTIQSILLPVMLAVAFAGCLEKEERAPGEIRTENHAPERAATSPPMPASRTINRDEDRAAFAAAAARNVTFVDVAQERGLHWAWPEKPRPVTALDAFGSGCAAFDGDNDGWQDVLLVCDPHPKLFRNMGQGRFEDVTQASGLAAVQGNWTGCAMGDYDGNGLLDILLTGYHCLALCRNIGDLRFVVATEEAGLDPANHGNWGASAGFADLDGDQWLDLVILNYVVFGPDSKKYCELRPGVLSGCNPRTTYPPERGQIWRNSGKGRFDPVPAAQGMESTHGMALVLAFTDLDDDGRIDFYIGNDGLPADFLLNRGDMQFENIALVAGVALSEDSSAIAAMGADWADFDRDGSLDLVVTNWQGLGSVLFRGLGNNLFEDRSLQTALRRSTVKRMGFGAKWADFENDGWPDLFFVNGHVYDNSARIDGPDAPFRQSICLLANDAGKKFVDLSRTMRDDVTRPIVGRGSATADFDNDGRIDFVAVDFEGPVMLLQNRTETKNHWLTLDLRSAAPNTFAYGARVTGKSGDRVWKSEVFPASSYLSSSDSRLHWGLGEVTVLECITVRWPSGLEETLTDVAADQILKIVQSNDP